MKLLPLLAYIDPMSGSLLLQAIIAGVITCAAFFRHWIGRALALLAAPVKGMRKSPQEPAPDVLAMPEKSALKKAS